jgi:hypothetical protein
MTNLKTTVMTALFFAVAQPTLAEEKEQNVCESMGELAYMVMELRQEGVPMSQTMQISDSDLVKAIIVEAYDYPRFSTQEYKEKAADDFRNEVEVECYKTFDFN